MLLSTLQAEEDVLPDKIKPQIKLIGNIIGDAQSEMRALLLHLRPIKLDGKMLKEGIEQLLLELKSKVPITITHDIEDVKLTEVVEDHLFRIVQELLSNVLRHSHANELEVYLKKSENFYQLRFVDDGEGFDMTQKKDSGFGLRNIRERIAGLGGNVRVISFPDQGTSVEIRIPLITGG
jgi:NarL family two-component system sensor histidine kinase LiaS